MHQTSHKFFKRICLFCLFAGLLYGSSRLYFELTDGFQVVHISSDFGYDKRWETRPLSLNERQNIEEILDQKFTYLGKGCQSYVFLSQDGEHVLKFFKYQRLRPHFYYQYLSFIPFIEKKIEKKRLKREGFFKSWVIAFDYLPDQTGLAYVHLNKTTHLKKNVTILDKIGIEHTLNIDDMEFLIQKKAELLCDTLDSLVETNNLKEAKDILTNLVQMIVFEYQSGIADLDPALMQNSGVFKKQPIHIDVGLFDKNELFKNPQYYHQELYNKTWKFRDWLRKKHPQLLTHLDMELHKVLGDQFYTLQYIPSKIQ